MSKWFRKQKQKLFSPKAVVQAQQVGPNSVRYTAKKMTAEEELEALLGGVDLDSLEQYPEHSGYGRRDYSHYNERPARNHKQTTYVRPATNYDIPKSTGAYSWQPTKWSTYSFGYLSTYSKGDDKNEFLYVKEPENYLTPTIDEIQKKINAYSTESVNTIKEAARVCYFKMINDKDYLSDYAKTQEGSSLYLEKKKLYDSIYDTYVPGFTPLEQAIAIHWQVNDARGKRNRKSSGMRSGMYTTVDFKRENYADYNINCQLDQNALTQGNKFEILDKISIIGELGSQFKVEKEIGETEVENSDKFSRRLMQDYSELLQVEAYQRLYPNFRLKFLNKDLTVTIPVESSEHKQKIILIVDFSGSMEYDVKQKWVNALLIDRFKYVMKGEAEIFFSLFVSNPDQLKFTHLKNAADVTEFWRTFSNRPNGSATDMGRIVTYIADQISKGRLHNLNVDLSKEKPEILIVNDGQDSVGYEKFPYKVNAISLMEYSSELSRLCVASGGKQVRIYSSNKIVTYEADDDGKTVEKEIA